MAVSSLNSTLFRCCTTLASPFIRPSPGEAAIRRRSPRRVKKPGGARSGCGGQRVGCVHIAQQLARAVTATPATRTDTELEGKLLERARAVARAFTDRLLGDGVADADIQSLRPPR